MAVGIPATYSSPFPRVEPVLTKRPNTNRSTDRMRPRPGRRVTSSGNYRFPNISRMKGEWVGKGKWPSLPVERPAARARPWALGRHVNSVNLMMRPNGSQLDNQLPRARSHTSAHCWNKLNECTFWQQSSGQIGHTRTRWRQLSWYNLKCLFELKQSSSLLNTRRGDFESWFRFIGRFLQFNWNLNGKGLNKSEEE